jgi:dihydroneopterin aldolase
MAQLRLENMVFYAHHGHYKEEQIIGGRFSVDIMIETDISRATASDKLEDALDYTRVYDLVKKEMQQPSHLLEHLAGRIIDALYAAFDNLKQVTITVYKINPPVGGEMDRFGITLTR